MRIRFIERWRLCVVNDLSTVTIKILSSYYNISSRPNLSWHKLDNNKPEALRPYEFLFGVDCKGQWQNEGDRLMVQLPKPFSSRGKEREGHFNFIVAPTKLHFTLSARRSSHALLQFNLLQLCFVYICECNSGDSCRSRPLRTEKHFPCNRQFSSSLCDSILHRNENGEQLKMEGNLMKQLFLIKSRKVFHKSPFNS